MPRDITHVILADEAAGIIRDKDIFDNIEAFHMGCVADDTFLYSLSPQLSTRLHGGLGDDTRAVVVEMMNRQHEEKNPRKAAEQKAFIYGYLCHMAADATFHPLIYSISGSQVKENNHCMAEVRLSKACHRYAETWLDLHLMRKRNLSFKNFKPFRKIITNIAMRFRLDDFFTDCFQNALKAKKYTWGDNFDLQAQFHNGMTRQLFVDKITQNQTVGSILRKLDRVLKGRLKLYTSGFYNISSKIPPCLTAGSFVHPVTGETVNKSIDDLEKDAVKLSAKFMQAADRYLKDGNQAAFLKAVPNVNLDTGQENSRLSDIHAKVAMKIFKLISNAAKMEESLETLKKNVINSDVITAIRTGRFDRDDRK